MDLNTWLREAGQISMNKEFSVYPLDPSVCPQCEDKTIGESEHLDKLLLRAIDETLRDVFKEVGAQTIYSYMESRCQLNQEEIAHKPKVFSAGLRRLLGSAAPVIENLILKNLYNKLRLEYEEKEDYEFLNYIMELRR